MREGQSIQDRTIELFFVRPAFERLGEWVEESIAKVQYMVHQGVWRIFWKRALAAGSATSPARRPHPSPKPYV